MSEIKPEIGERGAIIYPNLHDGILVGMRLKEPESLSLFARSEDGKSFEIELNGLIRFKANNFLEGNAILDVFILTGSDADSRLLAKVYGTTLENAEAQPYFKDSRRQLDAQKVSLLSLTSSYGCEAQALFRGFKIRQIIGDG